MSCISDAVSALTSALDRCFGGYGDHRIVRTDVTAPMDDVAIVDFSITADGIEVHGAISVVVDVGDWFGVCFVSDFSLSSRRWLEHGPIAIGAPEFARELLAACAGVPEITLTCPPRSSIVAGFRFDLVMA